MTEVTPLLQGDREGLLGALVLPSAAKPASTWLNHPTRPTPWGHGRVRRAHFTGSPPRARPWRSCARLLPPTPRLPRAALAGAPGVSSAPASCQVSLPVETSPQPRGRPAHGPQRAARVSAALASGLPCQAPTARRSGPQEALGCSFVLQGSSPWQRLWTRGCTVLRPKDTGLRDPGTEAAKHPSTSTSPRLPTWISRFGRAWGICSWPLHPVPAQVDWGPRGLEPFLSFFSPSLFFTPSRFADLLCIKKLGERLATAERI